MTGARNGEASPGKVFSRVADQAEGKLSKARERAQTGGRKLKKHADAVASDVGDEAEAFSEAALRRAGIALAWADDAVEDVVGMGSGAVRSLSRQIQERPVAALVVGLTLGWLLGRLPANTRSARRRYSRRR